MASKARSNGPVRIKKVSSGSGADTPRGADAALERAPQSPEQEKVNDLVQTINDTLAFAKKNSKATLNSDVFGGKMTAITTELIGVSQLVEQHPDISVQPLIAQYNALAQLVRDRLTSTTPADIDESFFHVQAPETISLPEEETSEAFKSIDRLANKFTLAVKGIRADIETWQKNGSDLITGPFRDRDRFVNKMYDAYRSARDAFDVLKARKDHVAVLHNEARAASNERREEILVEMQALLSDNLLREIDASLAVLRTGEQEEQKLVLAEIFSISTGLSSVKRSAGDRIVEKAKKAQTQRDSKKLMSLLAEIKALVESPDAEYDPAQRVERFLAEAEVLVPTTWDDIKDLNAEDVERFIALGQKLQKEYKELRRLVQDAEKIQILTRAFDVAMGVYTFVKGRKKEVTIPPEDKLLERRDTDGNGGGAENVEAVAGFGAPADSAPTSVDTDILPTVQPPVPEKGEGVLEMSPEDINKLKVFVAHDFSRDPHAYDEQMLVEIAEILAWAKKERMSLPQGLSVRARKVFAKVMGGLSPENALSQRREHQEYLDSLKREEDERVKLGSNKIDEEGSLGKEDADSFASARTLDDEPGGDGVNAVPEAPRDVPAGEVERDREFGEALRVLVEDDLDAPKLVELPDVKIKQALDPAEVFPFLVARREPGPVLTAPQSPESHSQASPQPEGPSQSNVQSVSQEKESVFGRMRNWTKQKRSEIEDSAVYRVHMKGEKTQAELDGAPVPLSRGAMLAGALLSGALSGVGFALPFDAVRYGFQKRFTAKERDEISVAFRAALEERKVRESRHDTHAEVYERDEALRKRVEASRYLTPSQKSELLAKLQSEQDAFAQSTQPADEHVKREVGRILEHEIRTHISREKVAKEAVNTALAISGSSLFLVAGATFLRAPAYGAISLFERWNRLTRESPESKAGDRLRNTISGGFTEWFDKAMGNKGKLQQAAALGTAARFVGVGLTFVSSAPVEGFVDDLLGAWERKEEFYPKDTMDAIKKGFDSVVERAEKALETPPAAPVVEEVAVDELEPVAVEPEPVVVEPEPVAEVTDERIEPKNVPEVRKDVVEDVGEEVEQGVADADVILVPERIPQASIVGKGDGITQALLSGVEARPDLLNAAEQAALKDDYTAALLMRRMAAQDGLLDYWFSEAAVGNVSVVPTYENGVPHIAFLNPETGTAYSVNELKAMGWLVKAVR